MKYKLLILLLLIPMCGVAKCHRVSCSRFQLPGWWGSADYLRIWRKERFYPPLATTNPNADPELSNPLTTILFGGEFIGGAPDSGARFDVGFWMTCCLGVGGGGSFYGQETVKYQIDGAPNGFPIIGRPFFNTITDSDDVNLVSFPVTDLNGHLDIETTNLAWCCDFYARYRFLSSKRFKFDLLGGYFYSRIDDNLDINSSSLFPIDPPVLTAISDHFHCENQYYAGLVGLYSEWRSASWAVSASGKVGLGNMVKKVHIFGETLTTSAGVVTPNNYGLLAQLSNSGIHSSNQFEIIPQLNANLQLRVYSHLWLTAGYTYMFWPRVVLAGEQVNLNIDIQDHNLPLFDRKDTSFWLQGFTVGAYVLY